MLLNWDDVECRSPLQPSSSSTFGLNATVWSHGLELAGSGTGIVPHAGLVLLRQLADRTGLTAGLSQALPAPGAGLERCQVFADLACAIVGGAWVVSDFWGMGDQGEVFGQVASAATVWRPLMASQPD
jgi:hypothetical protein